MTHPAGTPPQEVPHQETPHQPSVGSARWPRFDLGGAVGMFTNRAGGSSESPFNTLNLSTAVGDNPANVARNRALLMAHCASGREPVRWMLQVHGTAVAEISTTPGSPPHSATPAPASGPATPGSAPAPSPAVPGSVPASGPATPGSAPAPSPAVPGSGLAPGLAAPGPGPGAPGSAPVPGPAVPGFGLAPGLAAPGPGPVAPGSGPAPGPAEADVPGTDALFTRVPELPLGVLVADCAPVLIADGQAGLAGVAHAGRAGLAGGVVPALVEAMTHAGADPSRMQAVIGPMICGACYEVPAALQEEVAAAVPGTASVTRWGTPGIDIRAGVRSQLAAAGVSQVRDDPRCTAERRELYSYRRDGTTGRFAGLIWLTPPPAA